MQELGLDRENKQVNIPNPLAKVGYKSWYQLILQIKNQAFHSANIRLTCALSKGIKA